MTFPAGWQRQAAITIDATRVAGSLGNFPVLLTEANLPLEMFDADGPHPARGDGGDIRFSADAAGATPLPAEIVRFTIDPDPANGSAVIWVKVPSLSASADTTIYIWYGAASAAQPGVTDPLGRNAVWSDDLAVAHFATPPSGNAGDLINATGGANGNSIGGVTAVADGWRFNGVDATALFNAALPALNAPFTVFADWAWNALPSSSLFGQEVWIFDAAATPIEFLSFGRLISGNRSWKLLTFGETPGDTGLPVTTARTRIAVVWDGIRFAIYLDGALRQTVTPSGNGWQTAQRVSFASPEFVDSGDVLHWSAGDIFEFKTTQNARSAEWIATEYNNQFSPQTFALAGPASSPSGQAGAAFADGLSAHQIATAILADRLAAAGLGHGHGLAPFIVADALAVPGTGMSHHIGLPASRDRWMAAMMLAPHHIDTIGGAAQMQAAHAAMAHQIGLAMGRDTHHPADSWQGHALAGLGLPPAPLPSSRLLRPSRNRPAQFVRAARRVGVTGPQA
ncbi:MAG: hypothetical protein Tsb0016_25080 [Sphingomonadales bacterium]